MSQDQSSTQSDFSPSDELKTKEPSLYRVSLLNDDFTTQEFVIKVLTQYFYKTEDEAFKIMIEVHNKGEGEAGIFTKDMAETKIYLVHQAAKENQFPLKCKMEPVDGEG